MRKPYARQRGVGDSAEKDDEGRTGADHERIGKDPEGLDQPLLDRMRHMGRCGYVRRRAHACLVAEQAAPDALHERCAGTAAHRLLPTEGIGDDQLHDLGQPPEIEEHDAQRQGRYTPVP